MNDLFDEKFEEKYPKLKYATKKKLKSFPRAGLYTLMGIGYGTDKRLVYIKEEYRKKFASCVRKKIVDDYCPDGLCSKSFEGLTSEQLMDKFQDLGFESFYKGLILETIERKGITIATYEWLRSNEDKKFLKLFPEMLLPARDKDIIRTEWYKNLPEE